MAAMTLGGPAPELVESGFHVENADAPLLHAGLNRADLAHVLDLHARGVVRDEPARRLLRLLLEADRTAPDEFPYDPAFGEPYNSRERYFVSQLGTDAGWLHAGRPRREAVRIALRLHLRDQVTDLIEAGAALAAVLASTAAAHSRTWMPDQTYLQHAQPSTFGHYLLSFAYPVLRDVQRLVEALAWINASPGGAGCVNGSRLLDDRSPVAAMLGFDGIIEHTRDAMWQTDGLVDVLAVVASLVGTQSKLAEDLEIWASLEFDYVTLADGYSRASVLMPQKRNPYALSIVRGASGTLIGRVSGFLAVVKSPSARSDNLIYAYGEVPRALDLALRTTRLTAGVVRTAQAAGLRGVDLTGELLDVAAVEVAGGPIGLAGRELAEVLDPRRIVETRTAAGGAAPPVVEGMAAACAAESDRYAALARERRAGFRAAERALVSHAAALAEGVE